MALEKIQSIIYVILEAEINAAKSDDYSTYDCRTAVACLLKAW